MWFRFYSDALDSAKAQRLPPLLFKAWVNLLCLASRNEGVLPGIDDIAFALRADEESVAGWVSDLIARRLLDDDNGVITPHNWKSRQFKSDADPTAAERQARKRARDAADRHARDNGNVTRDVTPSREKERLAEKINSSRCSEGPSASDETGDAIQIARLYSELSPGGVLSTTAPASTGTEDETPTDRDVKAAVAAGLNPEAFRLEWLAFVDKRRATGSTVDRSHDWRARLRSLSTPLAKPTAKTKATRLAVDWVPNAAGEALAVRELGAEAAARELVKFRNYWAAKPNNATKLDWDATWQNWVLKAAEDRQPSARAGPLSHSRAPKTNTFMQAAIESQHDADRARDLEF